MKFKDFLKTNTVVFDGAFGTQLQKKLSDIGMIPEENVLTHPDIIREIHREYIEAGADVITAATFGANEYKTGSRERSETIIRAAVQLAREEARGKFVALDIGPIGELLEPLGELSFEDAYEIFAQQIRCGADADCILLETFTDLQELRAALLAARETCDLPVLCSMTFDENGKTMFGCDPICYALTASALADAVGVNCSLGPMQLLPIVQTILHYTEKPVIVQPNAGLPDMKMHYDVSADDFAAAAKLFLEEGVRILGGCCGTDPTYIQKLRELADLQLPAPPKNIIPSCVCSSRHFICTDGIHMIGERINPTGKKAMKQALRDRDYDFVRDRAREQALAGAEILDVNAGIPDIDEGKALQSIIEEVRAENDWPLQLDSSDPKVLEQALRAYCGKAIVNSVNGEQASMDAVLPLVQKYGAAVIALTTDENGIPDSCEARLRIADRIISECKKYNIPERDIYVDCLTMTVGSAQEQAGETLRALREIRKRYNVKTILGVSNISFGLPNRTALNTAFLTAALFAGLNCPIVNPNVPETVAAVAAARALLGMDKNCERYAKLYANFTPSAPTATPAPTLSCDEPIAPTDNLIAAVQQGSDKAAAMTERLLQTNPPTKIIDEYLIPALNAVGNDYERGKIFLPQLIAAAESAKQCFEKVRALLPADANNRGTIVVATVRGDIHDLGKNIVVSVLENYGYRIIDLGKNVPPETIADACEREQVALCGLSALMTTSVPAMEETISLLHRRLPNCKVMVGGAVLNETFAQKIGADFYCKDANAAVKVADALFGKSKSF